jgi:hypothetical protein
MTSSLLIRLAYYPRAYLSGLTWKLSGQGSGLTELKGRFEGQPMLVVGNGPSLNSTPLDQFAGIPSLGMNKIDLLFARTTWRPSMIITINSMVVYQHAANFAASEIPIYNCWKTRWLIPRKDRGKVNYFYQTPGHEFSHDITKGVGIAGTVTYSCLQFAHYMGANPVILFGVDHSFSKDSKTPTYETRKGPDSDHFDPNYFASGTKWGIPNLERNELAYRTAKEAYGKSGRVIYDATIGGKLQVFEKISVEKALSLCGR